LRQTPPDDTVPGSLEPYGQAVGGKARVATLFELKPLFQEHLRPLARQLAARGITPSEVAFVGLVLSAIGGLLILLDPAAAWPLILLPVFLLARTAINAVSDLLAREHGMETPLGASLNEMADVISDALLYLPLAAVPGVPGYLIVIIVVLGVIAEMAGVVAAQLGGRRRTDGPMGKGERGVALGGIALLLGLGAGPGTWLDIALLLVVGLIALTMINRIRGGLRDAGR
jgi:CDP-diacylglycerol--glycerol-3-phosphate 3-phosphatidyltransferase